MNVQNHMIIAEPMAHRHDAAIIVPAEPKELIA